MTIASRLTTFSSVAGAGTDWDAPQSDASALDGVTVTFTPAPLAGTDVTSDYLQGLQLVQSLPKGDIAEIRVYVRAWQDATSTVTYANVVLCDASGQLTAVDKGGASITVTQTTTVFTFTAANLATLALTTADVQDSTFGVAIKVRRDDVIPNAGGLPFVDSITVEIDIAVAVMGAQPPGDRFQLMDGFRLTRRGH